MPPGRRRGRPGRLSAAVAVRAAVDSARARALRPLRGPAGHDIEWPPPGAVLGDARRPRRAGRRHRRAGLAADRRARADLGSPYRATPPRRDQRQAASPRRRADARLSHVRLAVAPAGPHGDLDLLDGYGPHRRVLLSSVDLVALATLATRADEASRHRRPAAPRPGTKWGVLRQRLEDVALLLFEPTTRDLGVRAVAPRALVAIGRRRGAGRRLWASARRFANCRRFPSGRPLSGTTTAVRAPNGQQLHVLARTAAALRRCCRDIGDLRAPASRAGGPRCARFRQVETQARPDTISDSHTT